MLHLATISVAAPIDYESFAAAEMPRRRALGYPPHGHHAEISLSGPESEVRRAVESRLRPALGSGVTATDPMPLVAAPGPDGRRNPVWRLLLRGRSRTDVAAAAAVVAKVAAGTGGKLRARIEMDPEEV